MTCAFQAAFSRWTVGFGIEGQWNALRAAVGLPRLPGLQEKAHNLDYALLVKPHVVAATLTGAGRASPRFWSPAPSWHEHQSLP